MSMLLVLLLQLMLLLFCIMGQVETTLDALTLRMHKPLQMVLMLSTLEIRYVVICVSLEAIRVKDVPIPSLPSPNSAPCRGSYFESAGRRFTAEDWPGQSKVQQETLFDLDEFDLDGFSLMMKIVLEV